ncbi:MAG TPA: HAD family acid phosphatase [Baekduia sp.]|uniref:HAD family acid phosphatase n=1 Tax=Baekduia sp. TaxID=2600305 RepID=UPI002D78864F|nr:HAD family acid phosphatase [Baekduia sp.]HET6506769.1 HAD family acid phosphatase [Baekduia sp.]
MKRILALLLAAVGMAAAAPVAGAHTTPTPGPAPASTPADQVPVPTPIVTKLGSTPLIELWDGGGGLPYLGSSTSYNAGDLTSVLTQYHDSGVYEAQIAKVDAVAVQWLNKLRTQRAVAGRKHASKARAKARAAHHRRGGGKQRWWSKKPAIVFDIDETLLSNWTAIQADGFVYGPKSQAEATDEIGTAIKPSLDLYNLAKAKGIDVFLITGRPEAQRAPTDDNLQREGFTGYKQLVLKPAGFTGTTVAYKAGARKAIEAQGYDILATVGDQYSDLAGGYADSAFKLPNPFYYLP